MKKSTQNHMNVIVLTLAAALIATACAPNAMTSNKKADTQITVAEQDDNNPTGNAPETDTDINTGHSNGGDVTTDDKPTKPEPGLPSEPVTDTTTDTKPDVTPDTQPDNKPDTDTTTNTKPDVTPDTKPDTKPDTDTTLADGDDVEPKPTEPVKKDDLDKPVTPVVVKDSKIDRSNFLPLAWENPKAKISQAKKWSHMIYDVIETEEPQMLNKKSADDVQFFCPNYYALSRGQRLNFWGEFFVALALPESSWRPTRWMTETGMGIDPVTKNQVKSEGLLQLSYQDERNYRMNCGFDYAKDRTLDQKDPAKTIMDPYLNLRCGIKILAVQLKKHKAISLKNNVYWSVLRIGGKHSKLAQISKTTKALKVCQK